MMVNFAHCLTMHMEIRTSVPKAFQFDLTFRLNCAYLAASSEAIRR